MKTRYRVTLAWLGGAAVLSFLLLPWVGPGEAWAQDTDEPQQQVVASAPLAPEQLDQMLAPVALYPDPLLSQILMAATYPLEVVEADRWLQDPANAALRGDELSAALDAQPWDPSVKSLVPFPQVLHMMDSNLSWTEQLGDAFLAQQDQVMDSVQRLRQRAQTAGGLQSNAQQVVDDQDGAVTIEPANPQVVYVPVYDPSVVFGPWPYPGFPPYYFPGFFGGAVIGSFGFGWFGVTIDVPLWGWSRWDWHHHRIDVDTRRFNAIDRHRPPVTSGVWHHDPVHRAGVPYHDPALQSRYPGRRPAQDVRSNFRGYPAPSVPSTHAPAGARPTPRQEAPQRAPEVVPPTVESYGRGADVRAQSARGRSSRESSAPPAQGHGGGRGGSPGGRGGRERP